MTWLEEERRKERGGRRRRRKPPGGERNHEHMARSNSKCLRYKAVEAVGHAVKGADWGRPPVIVKAK